MTLDVGSGSAAGRARRILEVSTAVAVWIAAGIAFHLDVNIYLLLGIPLTAAFQLGVRREPLRALWVRDAVPFRLGATGWALALALAAYPGFRLGANLRARVYSLETAW